MAVYGCFYVVEAIGQNDYASKDDSRYMWR